MRRALAVAVAIGQPRQTWLGHRALGRLFDACGRKEEAQAAYGAAWHIINDMRQRTRDPGLRRGLESASLAREVEERVRR